MPAPDHAQHIGGIAELLVAYRFAEAGRLVCWPLIKCRYDLLVDGGDGAFRVQVKSGNRPADSKGYFVHLDKTGGRRVPLHTDFEFLAIVCEPNAVYVIPTGVLTAQHDPSRLVTSVCVYPEHARFGAFLNRFALGSGDAAVAPLLRPTGALPRKHWFTPREPSPRKQHRRLTTAEAQTIRDLPIALTKAGEALGGIPLQQIAQQFNVSTVTIRNLLLGKRKDLRDLTPPAPDA